MSKNYCCLIINGVVDQVIVADYDWALANLEGDWHDLGGEPLTVGVGYTYDVDTNTFIAPVMPEFTPPVIPE